MIQRICFIFFLLTVQCSIAKPGITSLPTPTGVQQGGDYFYHTIERGQTVYSIANMYRVSLESIYALNPGSKESIRTGDKLKIPQESGSYFFHTIQPKETLYSVSRKYQMKGEDIMAVNPGLTVETFQAGKTIRIPTNKVTTPIEEKNEKVASFKTEALLKPSISGKRLNPVKVALMLPFGLKEGTTPSNAAKNRMVEYYEGFLLALNDLKRDGISVQLQVYDTGSGVNEIKTLLKKKELQSVNLIIGGLSDEQIHLIATFANNNEIPYVIPFTSKSNESVNNYYVFQVNTPQSYLYSKTSLDFYNKFKNANIIFYESAADKKESDKSDLITYIKSDLISKNVQYKTIKSGSNLINLFSAAIDSRQTNVFVPSDDSQETLIRLIETLRALSDRQPDVSLSMFGHPNWQRFSAEYSSDFYRFGTVFYSIYYANPVSPEVKGFQNKYNKWYSRELINIFPKYGMLGYDTGLFFIQLLNRYGSSYSSNINKLQYEGVQTSFHFDRINNWGGFINTNIYLVEFDVNAFTKVSKY